MKFMNGVMTAVVLSLAGCAATPEGLMRDKPPFKEYTSAHSPDEIVRCMTKMTPQLNVSPRDDAWHVIWKMPTYGGIIMDWFVQPSGSGSKIQVWKANPTKASSFEGYATNCF